MTVGAAELVERTQQMRMLNLRLAAAVEGMGSATLISGSVAGGKTELLHAFADQAANSGALVLTAVAARAEQPLSLGVVDQLARGTYPRRGTVEPLATQLNDASLLRWHDQSPEAAREKGWVLRGLGQTLLELAEQTPLVITIDDLEHADAPSRRWLSMLVRRLRGARVMVVMTESLRMAPSDCADRAELLHHPYCRRMHVEPFTRNGVARVLNQHGNPRFGQLADEYHALTGGSPLLLRAAIEDAGSSGSPVVGDAFGEAVLSIFHGLEPTVVSAARALAVFGTRLPSELLGRLLGVADGLATRAVLLLDRAGLLDHGTFRHPQVRAGLAASLTGEERKALYHQVARLGYSVPVPPVQATFNNRRVRRPGSSHLVPVAPRRTAVRERVAVVASTPLPSDGPVGSNGATVVPYRVTAADTDGTDELSEAELRVATLAVQGYSNREIAGRLYITVSTVEQHLTKVYRKLRVTSRNKLPAALGIKLPGFNASVGKAGTT
ncbi:AAA family ATPase [Plantactinospora sp. DSM 117369]